MAKDIKIVEIYDSCRALELTDEEWAEIAEENGFDVDDDEARTNYVNDLSYWDWDDLMSLLDAQEGKCVVTGYFMAWNGKREGGLVCDSLRDAVGKIIMDDSHVVIQFEDNLLVMHETHHDAPCNGNYYEFRILTAAGEKWYNNNADRLTRMELCEHLVSTKGYTKNVKI